jgi:hypothetical protein
MERIGFTPGVALVGHGLQPDASRSRRSDRPPRVSIFDEPIFNDIKAEIVRTSEVI